MSRFVFERIYGMDILSDKPDLLTSLENEGYIEWSGSGRLCLTDAGKMVCDSVAQGLVGWGGIRIIQIGFSGTIHYNYGQEHALRH